MYISVSVEFWLTHMMKKKKIFPLIVQLREKTFLRFLRNVFTKWSQITAVHWWKWKLFVELIELGLMFYFLIKFCNADINKSIFQDDDHWFLLDFLWRQQFSSSFSLSALVLILQRISNLVFLSEITKDWLQKGNLLMLYTKLDKKW